MTVRGMNTCSLCESLAEQMCMIQKLDTKYMDVLQEMQED